MKFIFTFTLVLLCSMLVKAQNNGNDLIMHIDQLLKEEKALQAKLPKDKVKDSDRFIAHFEKIRQKATQLVDKMNSQTTETKNLANEKAKLLKEIEKWEKSHELISTYLNTDSERIKEDVLQKLSKDFPDSELTKQLKKNNNSEQKSMIEQTIVQLPKHQNLIKEKSDFSIFAKGNKITIIEHKTAQSFDVQILSSSRFIDIHSEKEIILYLNKNGDLYFKNFKDPADKGKLFQRNITDCYLTPNERKLVLFDGIDKRVSSYDVALKQKLSIISKAPLINSHRIHPASNDRYVIFYSPLSFLVYDIMKSNRKAKANRENTSDRFDTSKSYFVQISADTFCIGIPDDMVRVYNLSTGRKAKHKISEKHDHYYISGDKQWVFTTKNKQFYKARLEGPGGDRTLKFELLPSIPNDHKIEILGQLPQSEKFVFSDDAYPKSIFLYDLPNNKVEELKQTAKIRKASIGLDSKISVYCENGILTVWALKGSKLNPLSPATQKALGLD